MASLFGQYGITKISNAYWFKYGMYAGIDSDYFQLDSLGRIIRYDNATPAAGMLLKGIGSHYSNLARGTASQ